MRKSLKKILSVILVFVLSFGTAASVFGDSTTTKYIKDLRVGYGDSGKEALKNAGYTVWESLDANNGGKGDKVFVGYLETTNPLEAITKVSVMNMYGGYSFDDWLNEINSIKKDITLLLTSIGNSILEFQDNFKKGSPYAQAAYEILNKIEETDTKTPLGKLFLNVKDPVNDQALNDMLLVSNVDLLNTVETLIAYACTDYADDDEEVITFLDRLENETYSGQIDYSLNHERGILTDAVDKFQDYYFQVKDKLSVIEKNANYAGYTNTLDYVQTLDADKQLEYGKYLTLISVLTDTGYADTEYSLLDVLLAGDDSKLKYTDEIFEPLLRALTAGQIGSLKIVGIETLVLNAVGTKTDETLDYLDNIKESFMDQFDETGEETISIYFGVDRDLFENPSGVALSSDAIRDKASGKGGYLGVNTYDYDYPAAKKGIFLTMCVSFGIGLACGSAWAFMSPALQATEVASEWFASVGAAESGLGVADVSAASSAAASSGIGVTICGVVAIVAIIVGVIMLVLTLLDYSKDDYVPSDITYTEIPRAIIDLIVDQDGNKSYINYYAVKQINANEDSSNTMDIYGDLNSANGKDQWVVLYYTKDTRAGDPLTTSIKVSDKAITGDEYSAVSSLGSEGAEDLNKYNTGMNRVATYWYIKTAESSGQTASAFSAGYLAVCAVLCFTAGASVSAVIVYNKFNKKRKENA